MYMTNLVLSKKVWVHALVLKLCAMMAMFHITVLLCKYQGAKVCACSRHDFEGTLTNKSLAR